ncbi:MAG: hypothetical protein LUQ25_01415 [Methanoregulaceae archaeon]|nr:hypothetical protein [Methanoregulaceae archaeon]
MDKTIHFGEERPVPVRLFSNRPVAFCYCTEKISPVRSRSPKSLPAG